MKKAIVIGMILVSPVAMLIQVSLGVAVLQTVAAVAGMANTAQADQAPQAKVEGSAEVDAANALINRVTTDLCEATEHKFLVKQVTENNLPSPGIDYYIAKREANCQSYKAANNEAWQMFSANVRTFFAKAKYSDKESLDIVEHYQNLHSFTNHVIFIGMKSEKRMNLYRALLSDKNQVFIINNHPFYTNR